MSKLELWAGVECTVNRVGESTFDQCVRSGHEHRIEDLQLIAELGARKLRYPVLWERVAPESPHQRDWRWSDERLTRIRELGMDPIVGLVHHGSGPRYTSLLDPDFPELFAAYALAVAERYPWVTHYTPVNEPLTTARFCGLYGHWHPHGRDLTTFHRCLMTEVKATVLAMKAILTVQPNAQLLQTDDLGKISSTPDVAYQADFENERRWLGWDLLFGKVDRHHALWLTMRRHGVTDDELAWLLDNPCPPDLLGVNYYVTSERFLDTRLERYPEQTHGGNGRRRYADVETVRVEEAELCGVGVLLQEAWERYGVPVAVTEAHLGCSREEQMRWLVSVWADAERAAAAGADVRAVTVWSLFGAYDWNSLLTQDNGHYETGVFDVSSGKPRPTALARVVRDLAAGSEPEPLATEPGWWQRSVRIAYPKHPLSVVDREDEGVKGDRVLAITGARGTLGQAFNRLCSLRGLNHVLLSRGDMDIADHKQVRAHLRLLRPWAVVNTAGYVRVDEAEQDIERCMRENTEGARVLAVCCAELGIPLLTYSSDLVFDGQKDGPYLEDDEPRPLNVYGRSKAEAERLVAEVHPESLILRTSAFFGPWDPWNFVHGVLRALEDEECTLAASDLWVSPTYVPDLVNASLDLLIDGERGIWHLATDGAVTWAELARLAAGLAGHDPRRVLPVESESLGYLAKRPRWSVLGSARGSTMPKLEDALGRCIGRLQNAGGRAACPADEEKAAS